jgi:hypothetical protein
MMRVLTRQRSFLGLLAAFCFMSGLTVALASERYQSDSPDNAEFLVIANEACPYPPKTPASNGANEQQPQAAPPELSIRRPVRSPLRPAIYIELYTGEDDSANAKISI